jgi:geranylgeranyl pyrophosphate synthase
MHKVLSDYRLRVEHKLKGFLSPKEESGLFAAMRYSTLDGGKRLRALLVYATGEALGAELEELDVAAAAVEMVHAFSLIHDDLPPMDNDSMRRGKPTCHIAFGEATAILAGDALLARAFEILAEPNTVHYTPLNRIAMIQVLAKATGGLGMTGGQYIDIQAQDSCLDLMSMANMHKLKTGCLIEAAVELGYLASLNQRSSLRNELKQFATEIGLAFQIQDDILDVTGSTAQLGKEAKRDLALSKPTYVSMLGLDKAKQEAEAAYDRALSHLSHLGQEALMLRHLAQRMVWREQ